MPQERVIISPLNGTEETSRVVIQPTAPICSRKISICEFIAPEMSESFAMTAAGKAPAGESPPLCLRHSRGSTARTGARERRGHRSDVSNVKCFRTILHRDKGFASLKEVVCH